MAKFYSFLWIVSIRYYCECVCVFVAQLCLTLCDPMECFLPGSSVHGIIQARILEWVAILFFTGSSQSRDRTWVSYVEGRFFTIWATRETLGISLFYLTLCDPMDISDSLWPHGHIWLFMAPWTYLTLCDPMYYSSPGSSAHGILQARILQ